MSDWMCPKHLSNWMDSYSLSACSPDFAVIRVW